MTPSENLIGGFILVIEMILIRLISEYIYCKKVEKDNIEYNKENESK